ncbi:Not1-domain-containing protein [Piedraia hortae CBS 480.64]|uniref:General negative regulator of transcription subunit 1 n=1 Tax=Piedraia hortae CBS 480.64 TaxID=1314780 RepID=A0A6A7CBB0_9PEZI|nr:Not1-domain-containing protein [Piedraia hortae CBS 480.64]
MSASFPSSSHPSSNTDNSSTAKDSRSPGKQTLRVAAGTGRGSSDSPHKPSGRQASSSTSQVPAPSSTLHPGRPRAPTTSTSRQPSPLVGSTSPAPRSGRQSASFSVPSGSSATSTGGSGQLHSLVSTQVSILISGLRENNFETQAKTIRRLVGESSMDVFETYFRRTLGNCWGLVFPGTRAAATNAECYQLVSQEMQKLLADPAQADKMAQALDFSDWDLDLSALCDHFTLDPMAKMSLILSCQGASKSDLRAKASALLENSTSPFLAAVRTPTTAQSGMPSQILASIIERISLQAPSEWSEPQQEELRYAAKMRYQAAKSLVPPDVDTAVSLSHLLASPESRLAKAMIRYGPRSTSSVDSCKDMLRDAEQGLINPSQVACALLVAVIAGDGLDYDVRVLVQAIRESRVGSQFSWLEVVQAFDRPALRITKQHFLAIYNVLLPLAQENPRWDIQALWGSTWQNPMTQLSFIAGFLATTPDELDLTQIPNFRRAFTMDEYEDATDSIKSFAAEAVKHPLVSKDATEALFKIMFRSHEAYEDAQKLHITDDIINPNMQVFVCAASAVEKPWGPLQDQALKQLLYPFLLKKQDHYDFVMFSLWRHDMVWVASRLVECYLTNNLVLPQIFEHAVEQKWIDHLLYMSSSFIVDFACYAHGKGYCDLLEWGQPHVTSSESSAFAQHLLGFLHSKIDDEFRVQKHNSQPSTVPLALKTVYVLLKLLRQLHPDEDMGTTYVNCLNAYPRLFNYGCSEETDAVLEELSAAGHALPAEPNEEMEARYKKMYGGVTKPESVISELKELKISPDAKKQNLFAAMLYGLFEEYNCFRDYPQDALAMTSVLFGGILQCSVLEFVSEQAAIHFIFQAVTKKEATDPMYKFGLQAMIYMTGRLGEWPHLAERILQIPNLRGTQVIAPAERVMQELQERAAAGIDGSNDKSYGAPNGQFAESHNQPFSAINPGRPRNQVYEVPQEETSDKVMFVLNNVSKRNLEEKFKELEAALDDKHYQWFAHYLVDDLAKSQANFQSLYLQLLETFNRDSLWAEVLHQTYVSCAKMLNAPATMESSAERTYLKNLAGWLGSLTLARNKPILHNNLSFKDLLIEGNENNHLILAVPFTCKTLARASSSKIFRPPNPWTMDILGVLSELYHCFELKLNLKFEIEVCCKELNLEIKDIRPANVIRHQPMLTEGSILTPYAHDGSPDGFNDMNLMHLSKRGPSERFSPEAIIQALPDISTMLMIPSAAGNVTTPQMRQIFVSAAQQAIYEIIAPVVERSVTIASISTAELIQKDFATEPDAEKLRASAHTMVRALSGSLALVTCREPLRMSITNNLRIMANQRLPQPLPEGQIIMFVNDNLESVCALVESAAEDHSVAEIDAQLAAAFEDRRRHVESKQNEPYNNPPVQRWGMMIPEPYRHDPLGANANGLNRQQLSLYEEFGRQARMTPATHASATSQETRTMHDVLSDSYLSNLATPAETPSIPGHLAGLHGQEHDQANGYGEPGNSQSERLLLLIQQLQRVVREGPEQRLSEVDETSPVRRVCDQLVVVVSRSLSHHEYVFAVGQQCCQIMFHEAQKRLEVEVFCRILQHVCRMSIQIGRLIIPDLVNMEEKKFFNPNVVLALLNDNLLDIHQVDLMSAKALAEGNPAVIGFLKVAVDELLLNDSSLVLRADLASTFEALSHRLVVDPDDEDLRDILAKLEVSTHTVPSSAMKQEEYEYRFNEWTKLQQKGPPVHGVPAYLRQMLAYEKMVSTDHAVMFFRAALEISYRDYSREAPAPFSTNAAAHETVDALARLIVSLVVYLESGGDERRKAKYLDAILTIVVLNMLDQQRQLGAEWHSRMYFRLFSSMLCDFHDMRARLSEEQQFGIYMALGRMMQILQPMQYPAFTFSWIALLSHRFFVPALLTEPIKSSGGRKSFLNLTTTLLSTFGKMVEDAKDAVTMTKLYDTIIRFLLVLHHDYPEFLIENHVHLASSVPEGEFQMLNIINSAVSRAVANVQPEPFTVGLKMNLIEQIREPPPVAEDLGNILVAAGIKENVDRVCKALNSSNDDLAAIKEALQAATNGTLLANSLVVYMGSQATTTSSVFSAAAGQARLLERLVREGSLQQRREIIGALLNQVRYVNSHTHYFSTAIQHMFSNSNMETKELIMRSVGERLLSSRPYPWGLIIMVVELAKNPTLDVLNLPFMKEAPHLLSMLENIANSHERIARNQQLNGGVRLVMDQT